MINVIIFFLIIVNLFLIFLLNKKKIKGFFYKNKIQTVDLNELNDIFLNKQIDKNLSGPKQEVIVKNFCINNQT